MRRLTITVALLMACKSGRDGSTTRSDIARATVQKYVFEAYPEWAKASPGKECPAKLEDLNEWMNNSDIKDPWGTPFRMICGASLPPGVKGIAVVSAGEDRTEGTGDDIKSWE